MAKGFYEVRSGSSRPLHFKEGQENNYGPNQNNAEEKSGG